MVTTELSDLGHLYGLITGFITVYVGEWPQSLDTSARYGDLMDRYANVVLTNEGKCWRMILPDGQAKMRHPDYCPEPVRWVGRHRWRSGEWVKVWSCEGHAEELSGARRIPKVDQEVKVVCRDRGSALLTEGS